MEYNMGTPREAWALDYNCHKKEFRINKIIMLLNQNNTDAKSERGGIGQENQTKIFDRGIFQILVLVFDLTFRWQYIFALI